MRGFGRFIGWRALSSAVSRLVACLSAVEARRRCEVIDADEMPHWLYRDTQAESGRPTRQAMCRLPGWHDLPR